MVFFNMENDNLEAILDGLGVFRAFSGHFGE